MAGTRLVLQTMKIPAGEQTPHTRPATLTSPAQVLAPSLETVTSLITFKYSSSTSYRPCHQKFWDKTHCFYSAKTEQINFGLMKY